MTTPVAAYVRISSDPYGTGVSTANQLAEIETWAEANGFHVAEVFRDNDVSATSGKTRPEFERLMASDWTTAVVWHQDRLLRLPTDLERVISRTPSLYVYQVQAGPLDLATPSGQMSARVVAAVSAYEVQQKAERQKTSYLGAVKAGKYIGRNKRFGQDNDGTWREPEATAIREGAERLVAGKASFNGLARDWNAAGLNTPRGNPWTRSNVRALYKSPVLMGKQDYKGVRYVLDPWTPLLDEETWEQVQSLMGTAQPGQRARSEKHLLSGLLKCGVCGTGLTSRFSGGGLNSKYQCGNPDAHVTISMVKADAEVKRHTLMLLSQRTDVEGEAATMRKKVATLAHEIRQAEAEHAAWLDEAISEGVRPGIISRKETAFEDQMRDKRAELADLQTATTPDIFQEDGAGWDAATIVERRNLLESLFEFITVAKASGRKWDPERLDYDHTAYGVELMERYLRDVMLDLALGKGFKGEEEEYERRRRAALEEASRKSQKE